MNKLQEISEPVLAIGMMSGTSADGVDVALVRTDGDREFEFIAADHHPYADYFQKRLITAARGQLVDRAARGELERALTDFHAQAVRNLLSQQSLSAEQIHVAGFHGHTTLHAPENRITIQIGDANYLRSEIAIPIVSEFRQEDVDKGGQGAPLAPLFHAMLLADQPQPVAILNLGGVGNLTWIDTSGQIHAGDTGPGCGLLDEWAMTHLKTPYDADGRLALNGLVDDDFVTKTMASPYFERPFPKSADRFEFSGLRPTHLSPEDGAATLCAVTAETVARAAKQFGEPPTTLWVTGGGAKHPVVWQMLKTRFPKVANVAELGLRPDSLEAECFSWLAVRFLRGLPTSLPTTTGCQEPVCGGMLTE